ncbi:MAG: ImmA/IrrE family metallo-endopeptidase [Syntrophomonas sp.]
MIKMYEIAAQEGIEVEWQDFIPPVRGIYWAPGEIPPVIWLDNSLKENTWLLRCVMAEELGHHFTLDRHCICQTYFNYRDRLDTSKAEYRALRWAAQHLMPLDNLRLAFKNGFKEPWQLADRFNVTEEMVRFRIRLYELNK